MKNFLLIALATCSFSVFGQITITNTSMPNASDTIRYSNANAGSYNFTTTGASYNWDFSALAATSQDIYQYKNFINTPYFFYSQFLSSIGLKTADSISLGITTMKDIYTFYKKSTTKWTAEGTGFSVSGIPLASDYTDADIIYQFPLKYNDKDTDYFSVTTAIPTLGSLKQSGTRINYVDGWGTITTPYGNAIPCIRIKSIINEIDSLKTSFINFGFPLNRVEYKWLTTTEKIPVLEVSGQNGGTFIPTTIKYRDNYRSVGNANPLKTKAQFNINKLTGVAGIDTFKCIDASTLNPTAWQWVITPSTGVNFVGGTTNSSQNPKVMFINDGTYSVKLTATNFAGADDTVRNNLIIISHNSSISKVDNSLITIYPNPSSDFITIDCNKSDFIQCELVDISGKLISNHTSTTINIKELENGIYILKIKFKNSYINRQFIKN